MYLIFSPQHTHSHTLQIQWISQASAEQRQGRAGRVAPGHCYRLYSAAVFQQQFPQWDTPEICRTPLEDTLLLMKDMGIKNVETFPFPTLPEHGSIQAALQILVALGAVDKNKEISTLGRAMMKFPVGVRYAKMLVLAMEKREILELTVDVIAALTGRSPIIRPEELMMQGKEEKEEEEEEEEKEEEEKEENSGWNVSVGLCTELRKCRESLLLWREASSDALSLLRLFGAYLVSSSRSAFCARHFLREKVPMHAHADPQTMREMNELRRQIVRILLQQDSSLLQCLAIPVIPPTPAQYSLLRQVTDS